MKLSRSFAVAFALVGASMAFSQSVRSVPTRVEVAQGDRFSGNLASLSASDNNYFSVFDNPESLVAEIEFRSNTTVRDLASLVLTFESHVSRPGLVQTLRDHSLDGDGDDLVDSREASLTDEVIKVELVDGGPVEGNENLRASVEWEPMNDEVPTQDGWLQYVDEVSWLATPA